MATNVSLHLEMPLPSEPWRQNGANLTAIGSTHRPHIFIAGNNGDTLSLFLPAIETDEARQKVGDWVDDLVLKLVSLRLEILHHPSCLPTAEPKPGGIRFVEGPDGFTVEPKPAEAVEDPRR